jgi:glycine/serine hydroxymethyltransferase
MKMIASWINLTLEKRNEPEVLEDINQQVILLTRRFPLYTKGA